jgi:predicted ATPase with chaperone activity
MATLQTDVKKSRKKQLFETLYDRLDISLVEYKNIVGEKKLNKLIKRTSKELTNEISKKTKAAERRQKRVEKKNAKLKIEPKAA